MAGPSAFPVMADQVMSRWVPQRFVRIAWLTGAVFGGAISCSPNRVSLSETEERGGVQFMKGSIEPLDAVAYTLRVGTEEVFQEVSYRRGRRHGADLRRPSLRDNISQFISLSSTSNIFAI